MAFHHSSTDGVSQRVNSTRFSSQLTRRVQPFKRNNNCSTQHSSNLDGFESVLERKLTRHLVNQRVHGGVVKRLSKKTELALRARMKLGHWMFFVFCWLCLLLMGVLWAASNQSFALTIRTAKVSNVFFGASEQDLSENEGSQVAHVTFKDPQGAETAVLLSGATRVDQSVIVDPAPDYRLPAAAYAQPATENKNASGPESVVQKAEDVVRSILAKGFILGKNALHKAKSFDEKHQFTSTAIAKVVTLDQKIGFSEKISAGTAILNDKVKEMDQKFQVSEKTKTALAAAEQTVSSAGSAIMKNSYMLTGTSWFTGAFGKVTKAAGEVGQKTKDKKDEEEHGRKTDDGYSQVVLSV